MMTKTAPANFIDFVAPNPDQISAQKWISNYSKEDAKDMSLAVGTVLGVFIGGAVLVWMANLMTSPIVAIVAGIVAMGIVITVSNVVAKNVIKAKVAQFASNQRHDLAKVLKIVESNGWALASPTHQGMDAREHFLTHGEGKFKNDDGVVYYLNHISFSKESVYAYLDLKDEKAIAEKKQHNREYIANGLIARWEREHGKFATEAERVAFLAGATMV